jgi:protein-export membrane protein SecD
MRYVWRWEVLIIVIAALIAAAGASVFMLPQSVQHELHRWMQFRQRYNFQLHGGLILVVQMDVKQVQERALASLRYEVRQELRGQRQEGNPQVALGYAKLEISGGAVRVVLRDAADMDKVLARLRKIAADDPDAGLIVEPDGDAAVRLAPGEDVLIRKIGQNMEAAMAVFRIRLDQSGMQDALIERQGRDRIAVTVPGVMDDAPVRRLLCSTGSLSLHLADTSMSVYEAKSGQPPAGAAVYESADPLNPEPLLLRSEPIVSGADLADVHSGTDSPSGRPVVNFRLNASGARKFAAATKANVGNQLAIVFNGKVISAPRIMMPILGGSGMISGNFTRESAQEMAVQLRSGALPAEFTPYSSTVAGH